ncbi:MAG: hemerythrin domain-containing protein [Novosphingobium sp.]
MPTEEFTDAIALLKADHRAVEALFAKFEKAGDGDKQKIATKICNELKIHAMIEEEIFYPAMEGTLDQDKYDEMFVEHDSAKVIINDIMAGAPDDEFYDAKVKVLSEEIEHHVGEEEKNSTGVFAVARQSDVDLVAMRDQLLARKQELQMQAENGGLPEAELTALQSN